MFIPDQGCKGSSITVFGGSEKLLNMAGRKESFQCRDIKFFVAVFECQIQRNVWWQAEALAFGIVYNHRAKLRDHLVTTNHPS